MKGPTKVWKFNEVYSIEVHADHELRLDVIIDWTCGQSLYERAILDLKTLVTEIQEEGWTASDCANVQIGVGLGLRTAKIVNQFVDRNEAEMLAADALIRLKEISELS